MTAWVESNYASERNLARATAFRRILAKGGGNQMRQKGRTTHRFRVRTIRAADYFAGPMIDPAARHGPIARPPFAPRPRQ